MITPTPSWWLSLLDQARPGLSIVSRLTRPGQAREIDQCQVAAGADDQFGRLFGLSLP